MPNFKPKSNKKIKFNKKSSITLDTKHKEFLNEFSKDEHNVIPDLKIERHELREKLKNERDELTVEQILDIEDKINELTEKIKEIKCKKKDYFLDNSIFIFEYFENKKNISVCNIVQTTTNKTKLVNSFFKIKQENESDKLAERENNNIVQKYLSNIDDIFIDVNPFICQTDICKTCHKGELIPLEDEGIMVCNTCSRSIPYLIENEKPSYKEPPKEVCFYAYKRINHFKEILAQFQGKETTQIPLDVIENIKHYEHIPFIKDKLGIKPPIMSPELEETLCNLFIELQSPYSKNCPDDRVNFLNYYYTAYKLCELLGEEQYLEHFPMLKDKEKRIEQDVIWKKICEELDWEFIPTI